MRGEGNSIYLLVKFIRPYWKCNYSVTITWLWYLLYNSINFMAWEIFPKHKHQNFIHQSLFGTWVLLTERLYRDIETNSAFNWNTSFNFLGLFILLQSVLLPHWKVLWRHFRISLAGILKQSSDIVNVLLCSSEALVFCILVEKNLSGKISPISFFVLDD